MLQFIEFDKNDNFIKRIEAESANISSLKWILKNVKIIDKDGKILSENKRTASYASIYDLKKLKDYMQI